MEKRLKRVAVGAVAVIGGLVLLAVVIGVLNALVADGKWTFGWEDYRYDDTGFEIGEGSIPSDQVKKIDLDWIDGGVEIVACEDRYISLSESAAYALTEGTQLRWKLESDGTLQIKHQKSSWMLGIGAGSGEKQLTLRIPKSYFSQLSAIEIETDSANAVLFDIEAEALRFSSDAGALVARNCKFSRFSAESETGKIVADGLSAKAVSVESERASVDLRMAACPEDLEISTSAGDVTLYLPPNASFAMTWETERGQLSYDFPLTPSGDRFVAGSGEATVVIETDSGNLVLMKYE